MYRLRSAAYLQINKRRRLSARKPQSRPAPSNKPACPYLLLCLVPSPLLLLLLLLLLPNLQLINNSCSCFKSPDLSTEQTEGRSDEAEKAKVAKSKSRKKYQVESK
jgi:hypothetical protein